MPKLGINLRTILALALTFALLFGPCLSQMGFAGTGSAHAHGIAVQPQALGDDGGHMHARHIPAASGNSEHQVDHHPAPDNSPLSCEELCEGWAVKKTQRYEPFASAIASDLNDLDAGIHLAISGQEFSSFAHGSRSSIPISDRADISAGPQLYALTNRYRL